MAYTVTQLIEASLRDIGALASGESASTVEKDDAFIKLNQLLMSWNAQALPIYKITRASITLTGAASYALATRPVKLKAVSVVVTSNLNMPLIVATPQQWAEYIERGTADFGEFLYYEDGYPLGKIHIAPKVSSGTLELLSEKGMHDGVIRTREVFTLAGAATYTIGLGGTWATERPIRVNAASVLAGGTIARAPEIVSAELWAAFPRKGVHGSFAEVAWCDYSLSSATLYLAPRPAAGTIEVYTYERMVVFTSTSQDISALFPDGYERALRAGLAFELASEYPHEGLQIAAVQQAAEDAKTSVFGLNAAILGPPQQIASQAPPQAAAVKAA